VGPEGVMVAVGNGLTVTVCEAGAEVQPALVVVTVYVPPVETLMAAVVAPVDQR